MTPNKRYSLTLTAAIALSLIFTSAVQAEDKAEAKNTKTYTMKDLRQVVASSEKCKGHLEELTQLTKSPFSMQFAKAGSEGDQHTATQVVGPLKNLKHTTLKNKSEGKRVHRVAAGSFEINNSKFDYVQEISANLANEDHHYLYPVIIAADDANCYYTAVIDPSDETVASFKKSVESGSAEKLTDLHEQN